MASGMYLERAQTTFNEETKIWCGKIEEPLFGDESSIGSAVLSALLKNPKHIGQICFPSDKQYTNGTIASLSIRVAVNLRKLCLAQKDVIGLCAANSDFVAPLAFGALLCGLSISTLDPSFDQGGIAHVFATTKPKLMFCDGNIYDKVKDALKECNLADTIIYTVSNHIESVPSVKDLLASDAGEKEFEAAVLEDGANQVAMILCSSGTTGLPKGVTMSHASILNGTTFKMYATDKFLCFSTLYWLTGLVTLVHGTLNGITRIISNRPYAPDDLIDIVERYKVNVLLTPPSQIALTMTSDRIRTCDLSSITTYITGGSAVPCSLVNKFKRYATNAVFYNGYGMSEICGCISYQEIRSNDSVGQLRANVEVKIIDEDGNKLNQNEVGEICARSPYPWSGYYNNPQATKEMYDEQRWLHTGDVGYFDHNADLFVVDRKKDILKYNNFHFNPTEIERVIVELPDVVEVCVVGIPDIIYTHLPAAAVVKLPRSNLSEKMVCEQVANRMQHFEQLRGGVYFLDTLPHTASGKTLRRKVAQICKEMHAKVYSSSL